MKTNKIINDMFQTELNFIMGTKQEIIKYFCSSRRKKNYSRGFTAYSNHIKENKCESKRGTSVTAGKNLHSGYRAIFVYVVTDVFTTELFSEKEYIRQLKITFHHECRHAADQIIEALKIDYKDRETTAMLAAWINVEFEETRGEWILEYKTNKKEKEI